MTSDGAEDGRFDPYAAPTADATDDSVALSDYRPSRRSLAWVIMMSFSVPAYTVYWVWRELRLFRTLRGPRVGTDQAALYAVGSLGLYAVLLAEPFVLASRSSVAVGGLGLFSLGLTIACLYVHVSVARLLRADFAHTKRPIAVSMPWSVFAGPMYFQWLVNRAAALPAEGERRPKKRKKRKASPDEAD